MGAANFIKENKLEGPAFSDSIASSYLLWSLYPDFKSYLDLRGSNVFPSSLINDYSAIEKSHEKYDSLDKKYDFNYAVFNNGQLPLLQQHFYWGEEYNVVYADPMSTIYLKANEKNYNFNHNFEIIKLFSWPQSSDDPAWAVLLTKLLNPLLSYTEEEEEENQPLHAAKFYNKLQNYPLSVKILSPVISDFEDNAEANNALGLSLSGFAAMTDVKEERTRKMDSAKIYLKKAVQLDRKLPSAYAALADIAMMEGDFDLAKRYYDKSLDLDNNSHSINHNAALASYYLLQKTNKILYRKDMIRYLEKAIELNPEYKRSYVYLAEAYWRDENIEAARKNAIKARSIDAQMYKQENAMLDELIQKLKLQ
jgi:tetratricopeptide (TPR) repeat protein